LKDLGLEGSGADRIRSLKDLLQDLRTKGSLEKINVRRAGSATMELKTSRQRSQIIAEMNKNPAKAWKNRHVNGRK
jgi:hypothetical protein